MTKDDLQRIDPERTLLIDIREAEELTTLSPLPGSVHIPMSELLTKAQQGEFPKDKQLVTICRSGGRCSVLNAALAELGYEVDYLEGGLTGLEGNT